MTALTLSPEPVKLSTNMETPAATLQLKSGREKPVLNRHPWIFSGAIESLSGGSPAPGDIVDVVDSMNRWLARGYYNSNSQITVRILTWEQSEIIDSSYWSHRIERAIGHRNSLRFEPETNAYRLINAESDGLPGLVVDKYGDFLVVQLLTAGVDVRRKLLCSLLVEKLKPIGIVERSDVPVRRREGLPLKSDLLYGEMPPSDFKIIENGLGFEVDLSAGQKTGFYLDQRDNREAVCEKRFVENKDVLNVFSYTGGFSVYAANSGASSVLNVDISYQALERAERNMELNGFQRPDDEYLAGNAFEILRHFRDSGKQFDMVILDPPKFAHKRKEIVDACRGYKDINWLAFRLLRPGGLLATFSCSGLVSPDLFQKVIFGAAVDANREAQIIKQLGQPPDHPVLLTFPESAYLKGFLCRVN
jgi:23S rRNA (cytosine1962-C5)-methyltransferase